LAIGTTNGLTDDQLKTKAQQYFDANYPTTPSARRAVHVTVTGQSISLSVDAQVPTTLLKVVHIDNLDLRGSAHTRIVRSVTKAARRAGADNTGSMSETDGTGTSKISALKTATHALLTQLQGAAIQRGDVQVALIPFSLDVKMGQLLSIKIGSIGAIGNRHRRAALRQTPWGQ